jgi:hypothetical protein
MGNLFEYNTNTNGATKGKGTMLVHPLGLE